MIKNANDIQTLPQVEIVRSRLLKRVEWKIDNASKLPELFPVGEAMLSPFFAVAGIDKLRFQFFPSGEETMNIEYNISICACEY
jgi:hypothetical protein